MPEAWLIVALVESSEPWYHKLEVRGLRCDISEDIVGDKVEEDLATASQAFRASMGRDVVGLIKEWHHGSRKRERE